MSEAVYVKLLMNEALEKSKKKSKKVFGKERKSKQCMKLQAPLKEKYFVIFMT